MRKLTRGPFFVEGSRVLTRAYAASLLTRNASANALVFNLLASWMMKKRNLHLKKNLIPRCM